VTPGQHQDLDLSDKQTAHGCLATLSTVSSADTSCVAVGQASGAISSGHACGRTLPQLALGPLCRALTSLAFGRSNLQAHLWIQPLGPPTGSTPRSTSDPSQVLLWSCLAWFHCCCLSPPFYFVQGGPKGNGQGGVGFGVLHQVVPSMVGSVGVPAWSVQGEKEMAWLSVIRSLYASAHAGQLRVQGATGVSGFRARGWDRPPNRWAVASGEMGFTCWQCEGRWSQYVLRTGAQQGQGHGQALDEGRSQGVRDMKYQHE